MICPNCQMLQPQDNLAYCVRCNYPLQSRMQGFFTKSSQTGYSRADAYSAARRGQPMPQQYQQVPYPPPAQPQNANPVQMMYDANGNPVYVQLMYDQTGRPVYVQMMPKVVGKDAAGNPVCTMVPVGQFPVQMPPSVSQQTYAQQIQPSVSQQVYAQQMPPSVSQQTYAQQIPPQNNAFPNQPSGMASTENAQFASRTEAKPPPVPVLPRPGEQPEQSSASVPDRPAMRSSYIASSMYTANQQNQNGTGSFFARMQQQKQQQYSGGYDAPISAEELLQEAQTAFVQQPADANTVLNRIFESQSKEYQMNQENSTFAVNVSSDEVESVSEKNLYKTSESTLPQVSRKSDSRPEPQPVTKQEEKEQKSEGLKLFRSKKNKEKPKPKPVIVDADEIFGDSKKRKVEMLGISIDGDDRAVNAKLREMKYGGKKSVRSMKDAEVTVESMIDDPQASNIARKALTDEVVQKAYDSAESAEIAKALEQLNQGIFPKSFK